MTIIERCKAGFVHKCPVQPQFKSDECLIDEMFVRDAGVSRGVCRHRGRL